MKKDWTKQLTPAAKEVIAQVQRPYDDKVKTAMKGARWPTRH